MDYKIDEPGFLQDPWFHDGGLTDIAVADDVVKLGLKTVDGQPFRLSLWGTVAFIATDFQLCNIILDIRISTHTDVGQERIAAMFPGPHLSAAKHFHDGHGEAIDQKRKAILLGELTLFELTRSYGCEISALCKTVSVSASR